MEGFIGSILNTLNSMKGSSPHIWVPILFAFSILFSLVTGYFLKLKFTIFKFVSIIITIIGTVIFYSITNKYAKEHFDDPEGFTTLAATVVALIVYWIFRFIFFTIALVIAIFSKIKKKKSNKTFTKISKLIYGGVFAGTNLLLTVPGALLFSNVLLFPSDKKTSYANSTEIGVKILTGGKGTGIHNLYGIIKNGADLATNINKLQDLLTKDYKNLSEEDKEALKKILTDVSNLVNDQRIQNIVFPIIKNQFESFNVEPTLNEVVDKTIKRLTADRPDYLVATAEEKKKIVTEYLKENIQKLYNEAKLTNPDIDEQNAKIKDLLSNINDKTEKKLVDFVTPLIKSEELKSKVDIQNALETIISFFKHEK
ncbi:hypothetical protein [Mycoplasma sp. 5370]